ncbi:hypothetical protein I118_1169 [Bifidobacterium longum D2957]|nr:hypothetical protein I118_1169 [Bifidobacterium longum D2957]
MILQSEHLGDDVQHDLEQHGDQSGGEREDLGGQDAAQAERDARAAPSDRASPPAAPARSAWTATICAGRAARRR